MSILNKFTRKTLLLARSLHNRSLSRTVRVANKKHADAVAVTNLSRRALVAAEVEERDRLREAQSIRLAVVAERRELGIRA